MTSYEPVPDNDGAWGTIVDARRDANFYSACPVCVARFIGDPNSEFRWEGRFRYECGGGWYKTVDRDGNPIWTGRCGLPLKQRELVFTEEQP